MVLNEIEIQGVEQLLPLIPKKSRTLIYVEAGDWEALQARAKARAPISAKELSLRKARYYEEIKMKHHADVVLDNTEGRLESSKQTLHKVIDNIFKNIKG